jgi:hypothetical protein
MLAPAKAGTEVIPKDKTNAANINPLTALSVVRGCVVGFVIRIPS